MKTMKQVMAFSIFCAVTLCYSVEQLRAEPSAPSSADVKTVKPEPGKNFAVAELGIEMIWVPPGEFQMGSPATEKDRSGDEVQHTVKLTKGYWLGKSEVTQGQWGRLMGSTLKVQKAKAEEWLGKQLGQDLTGKLPLVGEGENYAMYYVSWEEAKEYCHKLTELERAAGRMPSGYEYAIPTEAQWEYACRAGSTTAYSYGEDGKELAKHGNYADKNAVNPIDGQPFSWRDNGADDGYAGVAPVRQYKPNAWGFYDMHGNVWEWCQDSCGWNAAKKEVETDSYRDNITDPVCSSGSFRVVRGGSWVIPHAGNCRSADRDNSDPVNRNNLDNGFRLALRSVP